MGRGGHRVDRGEGRGERPRGLSSRRPGWGRTRRGLFPLGLVEHCALGPSPTPRGRCLLLRDPNHPGQLRPSQRRPGARGAPQREPRREAGVWDARAGIRLSPKEKEDPTSETRSRQPGSLEVS